MAVQVRLELGRILASRTFRHSRRLRILLKFCVERTLEQPDVPLREYTIGVEAFDKPASFDPRLDPIVRVDAHRLRVKLEQYYRCAPEAGGVKIRLAPRDYRPVFDTLPAGEAGVPPEESSRIPEAGSEMYNTYLLGRHHMSKRTAGSLEKATVCFKRVIQAHPSFAGAHAGLAAARGLLSSYGYREPAMMMPNARDAAMCALQLDESDAEAHAALGVVRAVYELDWDGAQREFVLAFNSRSGCAEAHLWYAQWCLLPLARFDEADDEMRRALGLDPLSAVAFSLAGWGRYAAGSDEQAREYCRHALELERHFYLPWLVLGALFEKKGALDRALESFREASHYSGNSHLVMGHVGRVLALMGRSQEAREILIGLRKMSHERFVSEVDFAMVHLGLGEVDAAIECLFRARKSRSTRLVLVGVDPFFAPLRRQARYRALLSEVFQGQPAIQSLLV
ncbi:MAG: hypothetical protein LLG20_16240 [Acidobacteriales bacterium]|nr:hypothetical protein [Terriglobales bacterium]